MQLYVRDEESSVATPLKLLRGFEQISLEPGEMKTVAFDLRFSDFKLLDKRPNLVVETGEFSIIIGASSEYLGLE